MRSAISVAMVLIAVVAAGRGAFAQDGQPTAAAGVSPVTGSASAFQGEEAADTPADLDAAVADAALLPQVPGGVAPASERKPALVVSEDVVARAAAAAGQDAPAVGHGTSRGGVAWGPLFRQSVAMLLTQHAYRAAFEDGTWDETTRGPFWDDYVNSAKTLCCWDDGDKFTTNYLFHPMMGSTSAFVFANNHRSSQRAPVGKSRTYWVNKTKAMAYATAYSAYFEIGPVLSESAIGNVGLTPGQQTWGDVVITPAVGTAISVGEDFLLAHVIGKVDRRSHAWGIALALLLNPTRSVANVFAVKAPWSAPAWAAKYR